MIESSARTVLKNASIKNASIEESCAAATSARVALSSEIVPTAKAAGRILATDVMASFDFPPFTSSAMDGFAVRAAAFRAGTKLRVIGESRAGVPFNGELGEGEAVAISTGAALPSGADAVVPQEHTVASAGSVQPVIDVDSGAHIRVAGRYKRAGEPVVVGGVRIAAGEIAALAACGFDSVKCVARPRVTIIVGGDELTTPGRPRAATGTYDSNSPMISALLERFGARPTTEAYRADDPQSITELLARAVAQSDIVVTCGGISVGRHDHVGAAIDALDGRHIVNGTAARPGRRFVLASIARDDREVPVFALPGNPLSAFVCGVLYLRRCVLASLGTSPPVRGQALLASALVPDRQLHKLMPVHLCRDQLIATAAPAELGSDAALSLVGCDALAFIPPTTGIAQRGQQIECETFDG